ncbi:Hypothetical protein, putative [Bodo saltans]|uniref:Uncharacterized protein n=1 Tax=Bodo saltans TaxID=75058 RepID=A0A0S4JN16_BODSA|nr:Hypothetical protein, putative [Bodo saltans]|eukprot:CUG89909.1 Hypothetical protein, putative [Bodo saltans]
MECAVFSPCGRYWVRFRCQGEYMLLLVTGKDSTAANNNNSHSAGSGGVVVGGLDAMRPTLAAKLDAHIVEDISTSAGVKKDFRNFSSMIYNALIGKSASVSFFIENCDEMKTRIRSHAHGTQTGEHHRRHDAHRDTPNESQEYGHEGSSNSGSNANSSGEIDGLHGTTQDSTPASLFEREFFLQRKFFTLDYWVDFTRAIFPVPLEPYAPEVHTLCMPGQGIEAAEQQEDQRNMIARLSAENKKLKRENEALTLLSTEKMAEMQRVCEDLQRRAVNEAEYRKLKKDFADAKKRVEMLERTNDKLQRELSSRAPTPRRTASPSTTVPRVVSRTGRFDTPPATRTSVEHQRGRSPVAYQNRSQTSSRASTPPRSPRPAWGQHQPTIAKHLSPRFIGLSTSGESNFSSVGDSQFGYGARKHASPANRSSPHDRLYMMDTAASTNSRRIRDPNRALFH